MKRIFLTVIYIGLVSLICRADDISLLYREYLNLQGKQQIEMGNQLLSTAYQQGLIDSVGTFHSLSDEMEAWIH